MSKNRQALIGCLLIVAILFLCGIASVVILSLPGKLVETTEQVDTLPIVQPSAVPVTATPTTPPTPTPTPRPTLIPTPDAATLPLEIKSSSGWTLTVEFVEQFPSIDTDAKRYRPENGIFAVFIGKIGNFTDEYGCLEGDKFTIVDSNGGEYEMDSTLLDELKPNYDRDYPGFFRGQCLEYDATEETFLVFDVPANSSLSLRIEDTTAYIGSIEAHRDVAISESAEQTPTPPATQIPNSSFQSTTSSSEEEFAAQATLNTNANLRMGPGTENEVTGIGKAGETYPVYARTIDGWLLLDTAGKTWVASSLTILDREQIQIPIWDGNPITASGAVTELNLVTGLGISRDDFYEVFVEPNNLFEFGPVVELSNGMPRVIGEMDNTKAVIELIGPPDDLYRASLITIVPTSSPDIVEISFVTAAFIQTAIPTWDGASDWFTENLEETAISGEEITTVHEGKVLELQVIKEVGLMFFIISVEGYGE